MADKFPQPPWTSEIWDTRGGRVTRPWYDWFNALWIQSGGGPVPAPTAADVEVLTFGLVSGNEVQPLDPLVDQAQILAFTAQATAGSIEVIGVPGVNGSLYFNNNGQTDGSLGVLYDVAAGSLNFVGPQGLIASTSSIILDSTTYFAIVTATIERLRITALGEWRIDTSVGTSGQVITSSGAGSTPKWKNLPSTTYFFNYGDASPKLLMTVPSGKYVLTATIRITTAFDNSGYALSLGNVADELLDSNQVDPGSLGAYIGTPDIVYGVDTNIYLFITPGTASQGSGLVEIVLSN